MSASWPDWWPLLVLLVGALVTFAWRGLGVVLSGRLRSDGRLFEWIACVAYALLAGLVARMVVLPTGPLAGTALADRLLATTAAVAAFYLWRRGGVLVGCLAGCGALALLDWLRLFG
jgi:branched-subunit amino acid transport protein